MGDRRQNADDEKRSSAPIYPQMVKRRLFDFDKKHCLGHKGYKTCMGPVWPVPMALSRWMSSSHWGHNVLCIGRELGLAFQEPAAPRRIREEQCLPENKPSA